jgi:hypothetical protein
MIKKVRAVLLLVVAAFVLFPAAVRAQSGVQEERIAASFVLALGRSPAPAETEQWAKDGSRSVADLMARHRHQLQSDPVAAQAVIVKAIRDAFGREPSDAEIKDRTGNAIYTELMQRHIRWLGEHAAEYEQIMNRAYQLLLRRDAYSVEIEYWKHQPALSFALLVACIDDWARRNRPGLTATTGVVAVSVNSEYLDAVRLSPAVAGEARAAAGLDPIDDPTLALAGGRTVVAPGADHIVSVGGIHFAAAGATDR